MAFKLKYYGLTVLFMSAVMAQSIDTRYNTQKRNIFSQLLKILKGRNLDFLRSGPAIRTTTPEQPGCDYDGQRYPLNSEIYKGEDRESNWCYGAYCDNNGEVIFWDDFSCFPTTTTSTTTTPPTPTTTPFGCIYNGEFFPPGAEMERGEDRDSNWCYGAFCGDDGHILHWDNFECFPTTTRRTTTTPPPTTTTSPPPSTDSTAIRRMKYLNILKKMVH